MSKPSNPSWTGACLQGNLRLLSPPLFAMGRGWRRGPSSHGHSATATPSSRRYCRWLGSWGCLLTVCEPPRWLSETEIAETPRNCENISREALVQHSWQGAAILGRSQNALFRCGARVTAVLRHRRCSCHADHKPKHRRTRTTLNCDLYTFKE